MKKGLTKTAPELFAEGYKFANTGFNGDCYPFEVIGTRGKTIIILRAMNSKMAPDGNYLGDQKWIIEPDPTAEEFEVTLRFGTIAQKKGKSVDCWPYRLSKQPHRSENPHF
jgi:hypothetical protein